LNLDETLFQTKYSDNIRYASVSLFASLIVIFKFTKFAWINWETLILVHVTYSQISVIQLIWNKNNLNVLSVFFLLKLNHEFNKISQLLYNKVRNGTHKLKPIFFTFKYWFCLKTNQNIFKHQSCKALFVSKSTSFYNYFKQ